MGSSVEALEINTLSVVPPLSVGEALLEGKKFQRKELMGWQTEQDAGFEILDKLQLISDAAKQKITDPGVNIPAEDFNHPLASRDAKREWTRKSDEFRQLSKEPLVVALLAETEDNERRVYYFARRAQLDGIARYFTHSMSPIGHLATYEPGDEYDLPNGQTISPIACPS